MKPFSIVQGRDHKQKWKMTGPITKVIRQILRGLPRAIIILSISFAILAGVYCIFGLAISYPITMGIIIASIGISTLSYLLEEFW